MWKILAIAAAMVSLVGCSNDNQISIVNNAQGDIMFNFRAQETNVASGHSATIKDIPNGTYDYATTYGVPAGATSWSVSGDAGAGSLTFNKKETRQLLIFSSTLSGGAYTLYANITSSESSGSSAVAGTITGP
jgi:outer membrane receptor for ferric coprogen and ferric-rhodotorulic acid